MDKTREQAGTSRSVFPRRLRAAPLVVYSRRCRRIKGLNETTATETGLSPLPPSACQAGEQTHSVEERGSCQPLLGWQIQAAAETRSRPRQMGVPGQSRRSNELCRPLKFMSLLLHVIHESLRPELVYKAESELSSGSQTSGLGQLNHPQLWMPRVCRKSESA